MPTAAQRQHFVKRLEAARADLAAIHDPEDTEALKALITAYEALIAEVDHIETLKGQLHHR